MFDHLRRLAGRGPQGPDGYPLDSNDPYYDCHLMISAFLESIGRRRHTWPSASERWDVPSGRAILEADTALQARLTLAAVERLSMAYGKRLARTTWSESHDWRFIYALQELVNCLLRRKLPFTAGDLTALAQMAADHQARWHVSRWSGNLLLTQIGRLLLEQPMSPPLRSALQEWLRACRQAPYQYADLKKLTHRLEEMLGERTEGDWIEPGEAWSDAIRADLAVMPVAEREAWQALFAQAKSVRSSKPTKRWRQTAQKLLSAVGEERFRQKMLDWLSRFDEDRGQQLSALKSDVLKGLVWICSVDDHPDTSRLLLDLGQACYRKIPQYGARSMKVGNACAHVLGELDAVSELAQLRLRVKYRKALELIQRILQEAAARAGISAHELEEISVPTYGLTGPGLLERSLADFTAELRIEGNGTRLAWRKPDDKLQKSVPAAVKREHGEALKTLKDTAKDIKKMLPAQRTRLEQLLVARDRCWRYPLWRERYLDHPLLATLARRLIWRFELGDRWSLGIWLDGQLVDVNDRPLDWLSEETIVRPWHPLGYETDIVREWRAWLLFHEVTQPFKQAHREIYLLTDAEIETETYSNRFAAHVLRQHQLAALCRERGWRYALQGGWDGHNIPSLTLPEWGLYVEFWVEMVQGREWRDSLTNSGVAFYVTTDQVRFYDQRREPLSLVDVPAMAFSEVMRDVDLFVGVCSVGNDPNWADRGDVPGYHGYWHHFAFGNLSVSAQTRKEVLEQLIPRLKIADHCSFQDKYLVVQGQLRTYKIHLGSGNILMEPNNQYLCIVPDRRASATKRAGKVFLPFEGDTMTSLILSKAFLLARDETITDRTILRQIRP